MTNATRTAPRSTAAKAAVVSTQPTIVLKTVHDAIVKANPDTKLTTRDMRAVLRKRMNAVHIANSSWIFTPTQADTVRAMFDPAFAAKIEKAAKAATRAAAKMKAPKEEAEKTDA